MKHWILFIGLGVLISCSTDQPGTGNSKNTENQKVESLSVSEKMDRHIKSDLKLNASDKYDVEIFESEISGDDSIDYIITVNLLDRALNEAIQSGKQAKMAEMGYMGYYNYIYYMDGATKKITPGIAIASSPMFPLEVEFTPILEDSRNDFTIDYRVRNMQRRKYFAIAGENPVEVCQAVIFDGLGTPEATAFDVRIEPGTVNSFQDIVEYEATLEAVTFESLKESYGFHPKITPGTVEVRRWHFSPQQGKYYIIQK